MIQYIYYIHKFEAVIIIRDENLKNFEQSKLFPTVTSLC